MRLAVPRRHDEYDEATKECLEEASEGERLDVTLVSAPEMETNIRPKRVEQLSGAPEPVQSVNSD